MVENANCLDDPGNDNRALVEEAAFICQSFFIFFGIFTLIYHLLFICHSNFKTLVWMTDILVFIFLFQLVRFDLIHRKRRIFNEENKLFSNRKIIILILVILGLLSVIIIRPDSDDTCYVSLPIFYMENAGQNFSLVNHSFSFLKPSYIKTIDSIYFIQTIDNFWAYLARRLSCNFIDLYHLAVPLFMGAMVPLAWFWTLTKFTKRVESCIIGAIVICAFLLLNGQEHRDFGNFAFVRIWQGKAILMSIGFPIFIGMSITFFDNPSKKNWLILFFMGIGSVALTKTSLFLYPILLFLLGLANAASDLRQGNHPVKKTVAYWMSGAYPIIAALFLKYWVFDEAFFVEVNRSWQQSFQGQFSYVFGSLVSPGSISLFVFSILGLVYVGKERRAMLAVWNVVTLLIVNPITFHTVIEGVTTANAYWRLFYLLPYPLSIGIVAVSLSDKFKIKAVNVMVAALLVVTVVSLIPNTKTTFDKVKFGLFKHKIHPEIDKEISSIIEIMPAGDTIAPRPYSRCLQLYSSKYPLVLGVGDYVRAVSIQTRNPEFYGTRINAVKLMEGHYSTRNLRSLRALINQGLINMVISKKSFSHPKVKALIDEYGFKMKGRVAGFIILSRTIASP